MDNLEKTLKRNNDKLIRELRVVAAPRVDNTTHILLHEIKEEIKKEKILSTKQKNIQSIIFLSFYCVSMATFVLGLAKYYDWDLLMPLGIIAFLITTFIHIFLD